MTPSVEQQIAWTAKRFSFEMFVPHSESFPMEPPPPKKKRHIPYIYNASNKNSKVLVLLSTLL